MQTKSYIIRQLQTIPGVGKSISNDLYSLGIYSITDLKGLSAEELYSKLCIKLNQKVDLCMLYVFRCAIYFASNTNHEPEKLKWWNWKNNIKKKLKE